MMELLADYGLFLLKTVTVVAGIAVVLLLAAGASRRGQQAGGLDVEKLNDRFRDLRRAVQRRVLDKAAFRKLAKQDSKEAKAAAKRAAKEGTARRRVFVLDFKGDIRATKVDSLREEVSAIVDVAGHDDEVLLRLENPGGVVHEHGLAASQLLRLKQRGIPLTVAVDKVAASGGYLMACIADRIIAAPFAVVGSIGVLAQLPNFNRALTERGVDFEQIAAGKYKRTVTMFGKNTDADRAKLREELEDIHELFKGMVAEHRPQLDMDRVATGEHWYGTRALELGLVDELGASDDYLMDAANEADVYRVEYRCKKTIGQRLAGTMRHAANAWSDRLAEAGDRRFF